MGKIVCEALIAYCELSEQVTAIRGEDANEKYIFEGLRKQACDELRDLLGDTDDLLDDSAGSNSNPSDDNLNEDERAQDQDFSFLLNKVKCPL